MKFQKGVSIIFDTIGLIGGMIFLSIHRGETTITSLGPSCEICADIKEVTTTEAKYGLPWVWNTVVEKDGLGGYETSDGNKNYRAAILDFASGAILGIMLAYTVTYIYRRKK